MIESRPLSVSSLSDRERLRRIAELLCKAIMHAEAKRAAMAPVPESTVAGTPERPASLEPGDGNEEERVLNYLRFVGAATPATMRGTLGLSRTGSHRVLFRLIHAGRVVSSGRTRTLVYRLNEVEPAPDRIMLN